MGILEGKMVDVNQDRIDIPALVGALGSSDMVLAQNAGAMLGYHACKSDEHREAIAAQQENIIVPCTLHLQSGVGALVHNAALLLGQCLSTTTEFRQAFAAVTSGPLALAYTLRDPDSGTLRNTIFAMQHFLMDEVCGVTKGLIVLLEGALTKLHNHEDIKIKQHAQTQGSS